MFLTITYIVTAITVAVFLYIQWCYTYWKRLGVPYEKPQHLLYGSAKEMLTKQLTPGMYFNKVYNTFKARGWKYGGSFIFTQPVWTVVDMDLIKTIITKDFSYFMDHGQPPMEHDRLQHNLFSLTGDRWRKLRIKLTPTFTSGKLKMMFPTLLSTTEGLEAILDEHARVHDPVDIKELVARFTTDNIGSCAFGLECNCLKNPSSEFRKYGEKLTQTPGSNRLLMNFIRALPAFIRKRINFKTTSADVEHFFEEIINNTVSYRENNNIFRNDFMHLLIQLKNKGTVTDDESLSSKSGDKMETGSSFSMDDILAQSVIFFLAGFETSATTMCFGLLELSLNQEIQDKLRQEINEVLQRYDGKISYEAVMEMKYLDMIVHETLRKHPPVQGLPRTCTKNYTIPGTDTIIKKGTSVTISVLGIQHDPDYYPDPETFDPERFNEKNKAQRSPYTFLAFGEGPRLCIGARFGLMQAKIGILSVIKNFKITTSPKIKTPIKYDPKKFFPDVEGGTWLNVSRL